MEFGCRAGRDLGFWRREDRSCIKDVRARFWFAARGADPRLLRAQLFQHARGETRRRFAIIHTISHSSLRTLPLRRAISQLSPAVESPMILACALRTPFRSTRSQACLLLAFHTLQLQGSLAFLSASPNAPSQGNGANSLKAFLYPLPGMEPGTVHSYPKANHQSQPTQPAGRSLASGLPKSAPKPGISSYVPSFANRQCQ